MFPLLNLQNLSLSPTHFPNFPTMKYIIALNLQSRYARPSVGDFHYSDKHQRHIWKSKEISDIAELATEINAALQLARVMDQIDLVVKVYPIESKELPSLEEPDSPDTQDPDAEPSSLKLPPIHLGMSESLPTMPSGAGRSRGRPRKLAAATP